MFGKLKYSIKDIGVFLNKITKEESPYKYKAIPVLYIKQII